MCVGNVHAVERSMATSHVSVDKEIRDCGCPWGEGEDDNPLGSHGANSHSRLDKRSRNPRSFCYRLVGRNGARGEEVEGNVLLRLAS